MKQPGLPLRVPTLLRHDELVEHGGEEDPHTETGVPTMHVAPLAGWGSDPHGPLYWKGRYHLFYQARPGTCNWFWGLRWDHLVSNDMVTWVRLPPAIIPTPGGLDADGCFTGNIQVHPVTGVPMMFYTGARLRHNPSLRAPGPPDGSWNPFMLHWETQLCAVADPDDELLVKWTKVPVPWMELPHCAFLTAWRDPFFVPPELNPATGQPLHLEDPAPEEVVTPNASSASEDTGRHVALRLPRPSSRRAGPQTPLPAVEEERSPPSSSPFASPTPSSGADSPAFHTPAGSPEPNGKAPADGSRLDLWANTFPAATQPAKGAVSNAPAGQREHMMIIGSGLEGLGGTALIYRSKDLTAGWRFEGYLCSWPTLETGLCWECPHLMHLPDLPQGLTCCTHTAPAAAAGRAAGPDAPTAEAQARLVELAKAAWDAAGMTPADALLTYDITQHPELLAADGVAVQWRWMKVQKRLKEEAGGAGVPGSKLLSEPDRAPSVSRLMLEVLEGVLGDAVEAVVPPGGTTSPSPALMPVVAEASETGVTSDLAPSDAASSLSLAPSAPSSAARSENGAVHDYVAPETAPPTPGAALRPPPDATDVGRLDSRISKAALAQLEALAGASPEGGRLTAQLSHSILGLERPPAAPAAGLLELAAAISRHSSLDTADNALVDALADAAAARQRTAGAFAAVAAAVESQAVMDEGGVDATMVGIPGTSLSRTGTLSRASSLLRPTSLLTPGEAAQDAVVAAIMQGREQGAAAAVAAAGLPRLSSADLGVSLTDPAPQPDTPLSSVFSSMTAAHALGDTEGWGSTTAPPPPSPTPRTSVVPASGSGLVHMTSLRDIKVAGEAGLAGLGYAAVLSHHTPHDLAPSTRTATPSEEPAAPAAAAAAVAAAPTTVTEAASEAAPLLPVPTGKGGALPFSPTLPPGLATREEVRAACRQYAEAAAAVQGYDLGLPTEDSNVIRQCKGGAPDVPERAKPDERWFLGIAPDAATYAIMYFLGTYSHNRFDMQNAHGPFKLDLGNVLYAPLAFYDQKNGRHILWGYLKELWSVPPPPCMCNKYSHSGCVSLPRALYFHDGRLHQVPIPELRWLRTGEPFVRSALRLAPATPLILPPNLDIDHLDIELSARRGSSSRLVMRLPSWRPGGVGGASLVFDWDTLTLQMVSDGAPDGEAAPFLPPEERGEFARDGGLHDVAFREGPAPEASKGAAHKYQVFYDTQVPPVKDMNPDVPDWMRMKKGAAGGRLWMEAGDALSLRVFIDASAVEVFTGTGQALSTRVYRGAPGLGSAREGPGIVLVAEGGEAEVVHFEAHATRTAWLREDADLPLPPPLTEEALKRWGVGVQ